MWQAIATAPRQANDDSAFLTVSKYPRQDFQTHPWNLNGGGAPQLQKRIVESSRYTLGSVTGLMIGYQTITGEDSIYADALSTWKLDRPVATHFLRSFVEGDQIRDYSIGPGATVLVPFRDVSVGGVVAPEELLGTFRRLWRAKGILRRRIVSGSTTMEAAKRRWYDLRRVATDKFAAKFTIGVAFVATHNHFALDTAVRVFKQSAPVIKLPASATLADHLDLLGLLNSSTLGFWMKQVFFNKGEGGGTRVEAGHSALGNELWKNHYEYDSTKLQKAPITQNDRAARIALATALDETAQRRAGCLPAAVLASSDWTANDLAEKLRAARETYRALTHRMVALQEELDWLTYGSYGLLTGHETVGPEDIEPLAPGHRPFELLLARHNASCDADERSEWFRRHGHEETTSIPGHYSAETNGRITERLRIIAANGDVRLIEQPQFKRRWQTPDLDEETKAAAEHWLLDRLEDLFQGALATPRPYRLEDIVTAWTSGEMGARVLAVAKVYAGSGDMDVAALAERLLKDHAVPDHPYRIYTEEGIRKLRKWQETWALQDREDQGEKNLKIPEPPEFGKDDFRSARYFQIRGKLNVPRERFVLFADVSPVGYGWNGWRDRDRAMAQVEGFTLAESHPTDPLPRPTTEDARRCGATMGLWESLPDLRRWGPAETREGEYGELLAFAREACGQQKCPCDVVEVWSAQLNDGKKRLPKAGKGAKKAPQKTKEAAGEALEKKTKPAKMDEAERYAVTQSLVLYADGATFEELLPRIGSADKLKAILDDLVSTGDIDTKGRGKKKLYILTKRG
ncbi:MAG: BREX-2 system adenine-specific DNA-methyltransferase PglX [Polyangiaceae bacterium]|nr:BREX-2 system adenine-specific DNA-methyltransferase PglX [Polyangiaceae bacterium]